MSDDGWKLIGHFSVDAGLCWIGDPCYILHKDKNAEKKHDQPPKDIGKDWGDFCDKLHSERGIDPALDKLSADELTEHILAKKPIFAEPSPDSFEEKGFRTFTHDLGHEGLGIVCQTGCGDGVYPVYALYRDGRIASIYIEFLESPPEIKKMLDIED